MGDEVGDVCAYMAKPGSKMKGGRFETAGCVGVSVNSGRKGGTLTGTRAYMPKHGTKMKGWKFATAGCTAV